MSNMAARQAVAACISICTLVYSTLAVADAGAGRHLGIDDILALPELSEPRVSPDGGWVAFVIEAVDAEQDEFVSAVYMVPADGGEVLRMTSPERSASKPRWSPDGRYLAFLGTNGEDDAKPQVWTLDRRGGEAQAFTNVEQGVSDFGWAPDGERMWLLVKDLSAADLEARRAEAAGEEPRPLPWIINRLQFKEDGTTYLDRSRTHLHVVAGRDAEPEQLTFGDFDDAEPAWSPDGRQIAFVSNRTAEPDGNDNRDIWIVAADGGDREPRRVTRNPGPDYTPSWSHDGRQLAYVTVTQPELIWYATNHLATIDARGGEARVLTAELDRNVAAPQFAMDDRSILFLLEDSAEAQLARYDLERSRIERQVRGDVAVSAYDAGAGNDIAMLMSSPQLPPELYLLRDGRQARLTDSSAGVLEGIALGDVRNVTFESRDGTGIEGFIVTPPDYDSRRRYPTLLRIHGGPVSQYDFSFNADAQLFAAEGYVVVMANPRGSSGYGQDFSAVLWADWGNKDLEDVLAGVDYAVREGYADPERLGVGGWSYGGILTNYVITKSQRFAGAITGASEVLYVANYGHDHYQYEWESELGLPWENRAAWEAISPFNDVADVTTPTLIMGGKEDWNVPINNSEQLYQALKRRGVDTELVVYPGESHGFSRPSFVRDRYERYLAWYARTVRGEGSAPTQSVPAGRSSNDR